MEATLTPELAHATDKTLNAIGLRIREIRQTRKMTLQSLASATGLSPSMLSLVERGRASPSIGSLISIAGALGITLPELVTADDAQERIVTRGTEANTVKSAKNLVRRLLRQDRSRGVSVSVIEFAPHEGTPERPVVQEGFQYGYVLDGELAIEVGGESYSLGAGDLIAYSARRKHRIWNPGPSEVRTVWFSLDRDAG